MNDETPSQRFARLRPLIPNSVPDRTLMIRIKDGWTDARLVTTDLAPAYTSSRPSKLYRGRR
jgi:hypothetical protein